MTIGKAEVRATLLPGQKGTVQLLKEYGDQLVCVRYRYDKLRGRRLKTIELIIDAQPWVPGATIPAERLMTVRIGYNEQELREQVKQAGGWWDAGKKGILPRKSRHLTLTEEVHDAEDQRTEEDQPLP